MKTNLRTSAAIAWLFMTASAQALQPEILHAFQLGPRNPSGSLVQGRDGNFYGTTQDGGSDVGVGTVFRVTTNGVLTSLVSFNYGKGSFPSELVLGRDGDLYGTTPGSEGNCCGTVFKLTTNGIWTTLVSFAGTNGAYPHGLVLGRDGNFYGTTSSGGTDASATVFKVTTSGVLTTLVSFNGVYPGELVLGHDGAFYGTTERGGSFDRGTVFKVTTNGVLTTLVSVTDANGAYPLARLVLGNDGNFYGTTSTGGPGGGGTIFRLVISAFTHVARQPDASVLLTGTGPFNAGYRLWASADLSLPVAAWTLLTSASFDSNGNFSYADASAATNASRFYQLSVP